ncbi:hypothetical protein PQR05_32490 [Paraburkholderia sediminicola]|uniref:Uncharacterized protein n=1 Tax=Paraburkholderia metrosideri TaxID=580937 RepID=A0ABW9E0V4_9BURK
MFKEAAWHDFRHIADLSDVFALLGADDWRIYSYVKEARCFNIETFLVDWESGAKMLNPECFIECAVCHIHTADKFLICE